MFEIVVRKLCAILEGVAEIPTLARDSSAYLAPPTSEKLGRNYANEKFAAWQKLGENNFCNPWEVLNRSSSTDALLDLAAQCATSKSAEANLTMM